MEIDLKCSVARKSNRDGTCAKPANTTESLKRNNTTDDIENEVLEALFTTVSLPDDKPEYFPLSRKPSSRPVILNNFRTTVTSESKMADNETEDGVGGFEVLWQVVKEFWVTMNQYYKSDVETLSNGDLVRAIKLLKQSYFFNDKAKGAEAKSGDGDEDTSLNLHVYKPSEAVRLICSHLMTVSGIPSIQYLKLRFGTEAEHKKGSRRRRILQELETELIKWTEELLHKESTKDGQFRSQFGARWTRTRSSTLNKNLQNKILEVLGQNLVKKCIELLIVVSGATRVKTPAIDFVRRPRLWLELIDEFKATCTHEPSLTWALVLKSGQVESQSGSGKFDLSNVKNMLIIHEPIYKTSVDDFVNKFTQLGLDPSCIAFSYGLAENCTFVSMAWRLQN